MSVVTGADFFLRYTPPAEKNSLSKFKIFTKVGKNFGQP